MIHITPHQKVQRKDNEIGNGLWKEGTRMKQLAITFCNRLLFIFYNQVTQRQSMFYAGFSTHQNFALDLLLHGVVFGGVVGIGTDSGCTIEEVG